VVTELKAIADEIDNLNLTRRRTRQDVIQPLIEQYRVPTRDALAAEFGEIRLDQFPELQARFDAYAELTARHRQLTTQRRDLLSQLTLRDAWRGREYARAHKWGPIEFTLNMHCVDKLNDAENRVHASEYVLEEYREDPDACFASDAFHALCDDGRTCHNLEALETDVADYIALARNDTIWRPVLLRLQELRHMLATYRDQQTTATLMSMHRRLGTDSRLGNLDGHLLDSILRMVPR
jgi:hypothetical protein